MNFPSSGRCISPWSTPDKCRFRLLRTANQPQMGPTSAANSILSPDANGVWCGRSTTIWVLEVGDGVETTIAHALSQPHEGLPDLATAYRASGDVVLAELICDPAVGLSDGEAAVRLQRLGPNTVPSAPVPSVWKQLLAHFSDPLTALLLVATTVSFIVWALERDTPVPYEALVILAIVAANGFLGFLQERRAEQAVAALQAMASPHARVLRTGRQSAIPASDLVMGDIILLEEGDIVPADGRVFHASALHVSEAVLTGESTPVVKDAVVIPESVGIADRLNMVFSGTTVVSGRGRAVVTATGAQTEVGRIAGSLGELPTHTTPLQQELDRVARHLGLAVAAIALVIAVTFFLLGELHTLTDVVQALLLAVSLAVAAVPEGLSAVTTIVLALGTERMARRHVIVRKLSAVETLGCTTDICTDKTGTLTKNEMTVRAFLTVSGRADMTGSGYDLEGTVTVFGSPLTDGAQLTEYRQLLTACVLASNASLHHDGARWVIHGDPTEGALIVAGRKVGLVEDDLRARSPRMAEIPFTAERRCMTTVHAPADDESRAVVFSKGAPDVLLEACDYERVGDEDRRLTLERRNEILAGIDALAAEALRTLGVAQRIVPRHAVHGRPEAKFEEELIWLGAVGMIDPPRPEAVLSVNRARRAGIRPIMITGDHPRTAEAIAAELGIAESGQPTLTGQQLDGIADAVLPELAARTSVFARVEPRHKLRIVSALQARGRVVAMTGDGVNDAPALRAADIGIAMGMTGTDVSKGAADMILADDNFASIVSAVEEGRVIFANIQKFLRFLLSSNLGEVLVMFLGVVFADWIGLLPQSGSSIVVPLLAVQILWINLLTDAAPALALGLDPPERDEMQRPPRDSSLGVIERAMWLDIIVIGVTMAAGTLLVMDAVLPGGFIPGTGSVAHAQSMAFTVLVFFQLVNAFNMRSSRGSALTGVLGNRWLWAAVLTSAALQVAVVQIPVLQQAFGTVGLSLRDWMVCSAMSSGVLWVYEAVKLGRRWRSSRLLMN